MDNGSRSSKDGRTDLHLEEGVVEEEKVVEGGEGLKLSRTNSVDGSRTSSVDGKKTQSWTAYALDQLGTAATYVGGAYVADQALRAAAQYTGINPAVVDLVELAAGSAAVAITGQVLVDGVKAKSARVSAALDTSAPTWKNAVINEASNIAKAGTAALAAHVVINNTLGTSVNVQNTVGVMAAVGGFELPIKSGVQYLANLAQPYVDACLAKIVPDNRKPLLANEVR